MIRLTATICIALLTAAHAEETALSDSDREALLEHLDKVEETSKDRILSRYRTAMAAYRAGMASDEAAFDLYLKCCEKVNFEDLKKKASDFREWKRKKDEEFSSPAFRKALRYQLRWLVITLEASSPDAKPSDSIPDVVACLNALAADVKPLATAAKTVSQGVAGSVFARAYGIGGKQVESWPGSPVDLENIYDKILLPPLRAKRDAEGLRGAWMRRINLESVIMEEWTDERNTDPKNRENRRIGMADQMRSSEYNLFLADEVPDLLWQKEVDVYKNADQQSAAKNMVAHIEKYIAHKKAPEWTQELKSLLNPGAAQAPASPDAGKDAPKNP